MALFHFTQSGMVWGEQGKRQISVASIQYQINSWIKISQQSRQVIILHLTQKHCYFSRNPKCAKAKVFLKQKIPNILKYFKYCSCSKRRNTTQKLLHKSKIKIKIKLKNPQFLQYFENNFAKFSSWLFSAETLINSRIQYTVFILLMRTRRNAFKKNEMQ